MREKQFDNRLNRTEMRSKLKTIKKTKKGKLVKVENLSDFDYYYILFDKLGQFVKNISNRDIHELNQSILSLN